MRVIKVISLYFMSHWLLPIPNLECYHDSWDFFRCSSRLSHHCPAVAQAQVHYTTMMNAYAERGDVAGASVRR